MATMQYRVMGLLTNSLEVVSVLPSASLDELKLTFPLDEYPRTIQGYVDDIRFGRGGTIMYSLFERKRSWSSRAPEWERAKDDPRLT